MDSPGTLHASSLLFLYLTTDAETYPEKQKDGKLKSPQAQPCQATKVVAKEKLKISR